MTTSQQLTILAHLLDTVERFQSLVPKLQKVRKELQVVNYELAALALKNSGLNPIL